MNDSDLDMSGERLDPCYGVGWNTSTQYHLARYRFAAQWAKNARVLDVACGLGYGARLLAEGGAKKVVGVDLSKNALQTAHQRYAMLGLEFRLDDAETLATLSKDEVFDLVVSFETIEHLARPEHLLKCVREHMTSGAVFCVSTPWRQRGSLEDKPDNQYHVREWTLLEFANLLGRFFTNVDWFVQGLAFREQQHTPAEIGKEVLRRAWRKLCGRGWLTTPYYGIAPVRAPLALKPSLRYPAFIIAKASG